MAGSWDDRVPRAPCASFPHGARGSAEEQLADLVRRKGPGEARWLHVYRCGVCGGHYHVGHRPGWRPRGKRGVA